MQDNNWTTQLNVKKNGYYVSPNPGLDSKALGKNHIHLFIKDDGKLIAHHTYGNKQLHIDDSDLTEHSLNRIYQESADSKNWGKYTSKSKYYGSRKRKNSFKKSVVKRKSKYRSFKK